MIPTVKTINGAHGQVEVKYSQSSNPAAPLAIIMHPHPEQGGTMNNKVVYTMFRNFKELGFHVVRFNFRGVGASEGIFDFGVGELADALAVYDWFKSINPESKEFWSTGFSFGAWVAMRLLLEREELKQFICAGPPASVYDFSFLSPSPCSGQFIQGDIDEIVSAEGATDLALKLSKQEGVQVPCEIVQGADHFFTGKLDVFTDHMVRYIKQNSKLGNFVP